MEEFTEQWYEERTGTEMSIDDNICECGAWIIGEPRCLCGHRRIYLDSDFSGRFLIPAGD